MYALDLDPRHGLPLWQAIVAYFRRFRPLVQADQTLGRRREDVKETP